MFTATRDGESSTLRVDKQGFTGNGGFFYAWHSLRLIEYRAGYRGPDFLAGLENTWPSAVLILLPYVTESQCREIVQLIHQHFPAASFGANEDGPGKMLYELIDMFHVHKPTE